jgi:tRNA threonylcarbamoyladenosine biosynthesis protein TsaE
MITSQRGRKKSNPPVRTMHSYSPEETERLGCELAQKVPVPGVILLCGSLGVGKTTLTRGLARGFGVQDGAVVHSPSFTIVNVYWGRCPVYHVDLYRLTGQLALRTVGLEDFMGRDGVTIIEWGDRLGDYLDAALIVELEDAGEDTRIIRTVQTV